MGEEGPSKRRKSTESVVKEENSWDEAQSYRLSDKRRRELSMLMSIGTVVDTPIVDLTEDDSNEGQHPDIPTTSDRGKCFPF